MSTTTGYELQIIASVPSSGDALKQAEQINGAQEAIAALKDFAKENGGDVTVKVVRKRDPATGAAKPASPAAPALAQAAE